MSDKDIKALQDQIDALKEALALSAPAPVASAPAAPAAPAASAPAPASSPVAPVAPAASAPAPAPVASAPAAPAPTSRVRTTVRAPSTPATPATPVAPAPATPAPASVPIIDRVWSWIRWLWLIIILIMTVSAVWWVFGFVRGFLGGPVDNTSPTGDIILIVTSTPEEQSWTSVQPTAPAAEPTSAPVQPTAVAAPVQPTAVPVEPTKAQQRPAPQPVAPAPAPWVWESGEKGWVDVPPNTVCWGDQVSVPGREPYGDGPQKWDESGKKGYEDPVIVYFREGINDIEVQYGACAQGVDPAAQKSMVDAEYNKNFAPHVYP